MVNVLPFDNGPDFAGAHSDAHNLSAGPVDDLTVHVHDRGDGAGLRIDHDANPALYGERELAAHQDRFLDLLGRIADTDPHAPLPTGDAPLERAPRREGHARASGGVEGEKIARVRRGRVRSGRNRRTMCATAAPASPGAGR